MDKKHCAQTVPIRKRLFSITELVIEFGVTAWFWRTQIWDGKLPVIQVGKKMLIDSNDIETFIRNNKMNHS